MRRRSLLAYDGTLAASLALTIYRTLISTRGMTIQVISTLVSFKDLFGALMGIDVTAGQNEVARLRPLQSEI